MDLLSLYKSLSKEEISTIAKAIGSSPQTIYQVAAGYRNASPAWAVKLEKALNGKCTAEEILRLNHLRKNNKAA